MEYALKILEIKQQEIAKTNNSLLDPLEKFIQKITKTFEELPKAVFISTNNHQDKQFFFSPNLKGDKIKVISPVIAQQTGNESSGQRFAIIQPNLDLACKQRWGFKINKLVGWIGVGICHVTLLSGFQYNFKYTSVGHGSYLVSGNGYTWSHYKSENNSASKSFGFATGDTIYVEFDPTMKKVKFVKNKTLENYTLDVDLKGDDDVAPCVNLCSVGDEVEIIQNSNELDSISF